LGSKSSFQLPAVFKNSHRQGLLTQNRFEQLEMSADQNKNGFNQIKFKKISK